MLFGSIVFLFALLTENSRAYRISYFPQHAPNNVTETFLNCVHAKLGHLDFNVTKSPRIGRLVLMPSARRRFTPAEEQIFGSCLTLAAANTHFEFQSSVYEDENTLSSVGIGQLRDSLDYTIQIITRDESDTVCNNEINRMMKSSGGITYSCFEENGACGGGNTPLGTEIDLFLRSWSIKYQLLSFR